MDEFNYDSLRAKQSRFGRFFQSKLMVFLLMLIAVAIVCGGGYLLWQRNSLGWLCIGLAAPFLMFYYWNKHVLQKVPIGKSDNINDLLSRECLASMPRNPQPVQIAQLLIKTQSGRFLMLRLGLGQQVFLDVAKNIAKTQTIFQNAKVIREYTNSEQISGAVLGVAVLTSVIGYDKLLDQMQLSVDDLYQVVNWFNYLHGVVRGAEKPHRSGGIARDLTFGYTPLLNHFGANISEQRSHINKTQIHQTAHQEVLERMKQILSERGRQNVALVGAYGSGRTTIVNAFAEMLLDASADLPKNLRFCQIFALDVSAIISAAKNPAELPELVLSLMNEAYAARNIIICLKNAHLFFENGIGSVDISNILLPVIEAGNVRMILTIDQQRFLEISAKNSALANALNKIMVQPANEIETMRVLCDQAPFLEYQHGVTFTYQSLKAAYKLSARYIHDVEMPGKAKMLLETSANYANSNKLVMAKSVQEAVEKTQGVKVQVVQDTAERDQLLDMEGRIHQRMVDQEEAVHTVSSALRRAAAGVRNQGRPIGTFLFLGPTGVGKTELAKAVSEVYFKGEEHIVRLDLNEFVSADDVKRLIADGAENSLSLTAQVLKQPFAVVLLDEIEKAHSQVLTTLLQVLDEGILRDANNREVNFRDTIIIATSNAGATKIREMVSSGKAPKEAKDELVNYLIQNNEFRPEFLNRFDEICLFKPLSKADLLQVLDLILKSVNKTLAEQKIQVALNDDAKALLVERGYDPQLGARPMRRIVQKTVENIVAKAVLAGTATAGAELQITADQIQQELAEL